ncbi:Rrf2 family transcriptional regulator [Morganella morganii]
MKVAIEVGGAVIWFRDQEKKEGMACTGYIKDGTQQKIISVLEDALTQAKAELGLIQDVD